MSNVPLLGYLAGDGSWASPLRRMKTSKSLNTLVEEKCGGARRAAAVWLVAPIVIGLVLGLVLPTSCLLPWPWNRVSQIIGWIYFAAWSVSFYPQLHLNYRRKSVSGLSLDFQLLNMLGFTCYAIYNAALFWSPVVREEYSRTHGGYLPPVYANDVFFALHAAAITALTLVQCGLYDRGGSRPSWPAVLATAATALGAAAYAAAVAATPRVTPHCLGTEEGGCVEDGWLNWLAFLYTLSFVKMAVSLVKYIPQVVLNYKLKSTVGWNIWNVLLDAEGGLLSLVQLFMDSGITHDWSPVTGNPIKFGLGFTSIFFDAIFLHFIFYQERPCAPGPRVPVIVEQEGDLEAAEEDEHEERGGAGGPTAERQPLVQPQAARSAPAPEQQ
eukprot:scaffold15.g4367.t1